MKRSIHFSRVLPATLALTAFSCAASVTLLTAGCGGGGKSSTTQSAATRKNGSVTMTIKWPRPDGTRKIPLAAQSITLLITGEGGTQTQTVARPANGAPSPVTFSNLPIRGEYLLTGTAYEFADGTGVALAKASVPVRFTIAEPTKSATLDLATTIVRLAISPDPISLSTDGANNVLSLSAAGFDAATGGNLVPVSDVNYSIASEVVATLFKDPATGVWTITGRTEGQTSLTATDTETGITTTVTVEVGRIASPVWSQSLDGPVLSSAALSTNGSVFVGGTQGRLYGFNPAGASLPNFPLDLNALPEQISTPVFHAADNFLFAVGDSNVDRGNLYAVNSLNGNQLFTVPIDGAYVIGDGVRGSRITATVSVDPNLPLIRVPTKNGTIASFRYTINGGTGNVTPDGPPIYTTVTATPSFVTTPALGTGGYYVASSTLVSQSAQFHAFRNDDTAQYPPVSLDGALAAGVVLSSDGTRAFVATGLTAGGGVKVYGITTADGAILWTRTLPNATMVSGAPVVGPDGTVYVGTWGGEVTSGLVGGQVFALAPATGDIQTGWPFRVPFDANTSLFSDIDSSVAVGADGTVYAGSWNGKLYGIRPTGSKLYEASLLDVIRVSPVVGPDNTVYIGSDNFSFTAFR